MSQPTCAEDLAWRGLVHQMTDEALPRVLDETTLTAYIGFDPTADSLHLGNLLMLCTLRRLQQAGHNVIALAGGGTGMIGDPGGKSDERNLLTRDDLAHNLACIKGQLERFIDLDGDKGRMVDNGDWLWHIPVLEFLRDTGKHFTINQMIAKEMVKERIADESKSISYTEFSYMLLQSRDFLELFDRHGCTLQLGGSDQWGNIAMGVELIRKVRGAHAYGLTSPLVTKADGTKFGKSVGGALWLDAAKTSPYALWQFLFNAEDAKVGSYLRSFTWLSREEIEDLDRQTAEAPGKRAAGRALANSVVALVHGEAEAAAAERAAAVLFTEEVRLLSRSDLAAALEDVPRFETGRSEAHALQLAWAIHNAQPVGLARSLSAARTLISQGGVAVNGQRVVGTDAMISEFEPLFGETLVVRVGRRQIMSIELRD